MSSPAGSTPPAPAEAALTHRQILVIMSGLMMGMFLASLDQTIVSTALPTIVGDFHRSDLLSWVITAYLLASTASTPLWGKAGDLYGRKRVFQLAIVVFLVGSALCGASQNMYELIGFRGLQGIGGGGLISLVFAIIGDVIPPRQRGRYQGYFGAVFGVSSVVGPLAGGFAVDSLSWRYIFYINLPLGIAALVVTNRVLRLPVRKRKVNIDWWGALLLVAGVSSILLATQSGGTDYPWASIQIVGLFTLGGLFLIGFAVRERLAPEPILPLELFRMRIFTVANIVSFISGIAMFGALAFLPQYHAACPRCLSHHVRAAAAAPAGRPLGHEHQLRALHLAHRQLPLVPADRHHPGDDRPQSAHQGWRAYLAAHRRRRHPDLRSRPRAVHAGPDPGRAKRRADETDGRRHVIGHLLSLHGRRDRRVRARRRADRPDRVRVAAARAGGRPRGCRRQGHPVGAEPGHLEQAQAHQSSPARGHHPGVLARHRSALPGGRASVDPRRDRGPVHPAGPITSVQRLRCTAGQRTPAPIDAGDTALITGGTH